MADITLHLGDCLAIMPTLESGSVDAVITDMPYSSGGMVRGDRAAQPSTKYVQTTSYQTCREQFHGDNRDQRSFALWCALWLEMARRVAKPGSPIVLFTDWRQLASVVDAVQVGGWVYRGLAVWHKPGIRMQRGRFSHSAEYLVYGSNGPVTPGEKSPQNVFAWQPVDGEDKEHIAEKPPEVLSWALGVTVADAVVFDPFMGTGSTAVACLRMGRRFVGCEIDPHHYATAERNVKEARQEFALFANLP